MDPEQLASQMQHIRENLIHAGMNPNMIEEAPLRGTALFIHERRLGLRDFSLAVAYGAIKWCMEHGKLEI